MIIRDVKPYPLQVGRRHQLCVKVETDEGIYGWGESGLSGREAAVMGALQHFKGFLVGKDPFNTAGLWQELYRSNYFEGGRVLAAAISAIDIALHDIKGKALGVPVYQLLGGRQRDFIPLFATTAAPMCPQLIEDARLLIKEGWNVIRTWMHVPEVAGPDGQPDRRIYEPRESIAVTAHWLNTLREEIGSETVLGIDYHHRLSVAEAASFCQRLKPGTLDFLEEPIRDETPEAYESLRTLTNVPFAIGEEFASKWQFLPYIERGITQFVRLDVCNVGGLTEAMKVAGWAEAHYIDLMPHNPLGPICTAASLHMAAAVPNFAWLETWAMRSSTSSHEDDELFPVRPKLTGTFFPTPEGPGIGIEVDEEKVKAQSFRFWEAPHFHRRDGSYTNW